MLSAMNTAKLSGCFLPCALQSLDQLALHVGMT